MENRLLAEAAALPFVAFKVVPLANRSAHVHAYDVANTFNAPDSRQSSRRLPVICVIWG